ncbi:MAG: hypothetical protein LBO79_05930 [Zoogloeaceae bacterium]|nr:hypothetical protein [Zoogloeaceae bacterium]
MTFPDPPGHGGQGIRRPEYAKARIPDGGALAPGPADATGKVAPIPAATRVLVGKAVATGEPLAYCRDSRLEFVLR